MTGTNIEGLDIISEEVRCFQSTMAFVKCWGPIPEHWPTRKVAKDCITVSSGGRNGWMGRKKHQRSVSVLGRPICRSGKFWTPLLSVYFLQNMRIYEWKKNGAPKSTYFLSKWDSNPLIKVEESLNWLKLGIFSQNWLTGTFPSREMAARMDSSPRPMIFRMSSLPPVPSMKFWLKVNMLWAKSEKKHFSFRVSNRVHHSAENINPTTNLKARASLQLPLTRNSWSQCVGIWGLDDLILWSSLQGKQLDHLSLRNFASFFGCIVARKTVIALIQRFLFPTWKN